MSWREGVKKFLSDKFGKNVNIISESYVGGGSINDTRMIKTEEGDFFVKINSASRYPQMFEKEAKGLEILKQADVIDIPNVVGFGENNDDAFLILNYIKSSAKSPGFWTEFGEKLAMLHKNSNEYFGLDHDNYIGSLHQSNKPHKTWEDFFREERLEPQIEKAYNSGEIDKATIKMFDRFFNKLGEIFPVEPPSLIHGDLWGGNYMVNETGNPVLIDPAVYYGHREMDLGMSQLFGGFSNEFYRAYDNTFPLEPGWQKRLDYCNLYPLMVHVNLFGGGYVGSVKTILSKFK